VAVALNPATGELVRLMDEAEAQEITNRIRGTAEALWSLLLEAHERQAWKALGYDRWEDYVRTEFGMNRSRSYQVLDQGRVIRAIGDAADVQDLGHLPRITHEQTREIKPRLGDVTAAIRERIADEATREAPERVQEIVAEVIAEHRAQIRQRDEDAAALAEIRELAATAGVDMDEDRMAQRGQFARLCRDLVALPSPAEFVARHGDHLTDRHRTAAADAWRWLDQFLATQEES